MNLHPDISKSEGFEEIGEYFLIGHTENELFVLDDTGHTLQTIDFYNHVQTIKSFDEKLYVLTLDSLFILDDVLNSISSSAVPGYAKYSNLKVTAEEIRFLSTTDSTHVILATDHQLNLISSTHIPIGASDASQQDFSGTHFSQAIKFRLTRNHAIRMMDFSTSLDDVAFVNSTDAALQDIELIDYTLEPHPYIPSLLILQAHMQVLLKNQGNNTLNTVWLNRELGPAICNSAYYRKEFTDLYLSPGDSTWLDLGWHHISNYVSSQDSVLHRTFCFFSSSPNKLMDINVPNDEICKTISFMIVGAEEIGQQKIGVYPNPTSGELYFTSTHHDHFRVQLMDIHGRIAFIRDSNSGPINLSHLPAGVYLLNISDRNGRELHTSKILKD